MALKRIGVLTGGGDAPGLNPAIRALTWKAQELGIETATSCLAPIAFASHGYEKFHLLMPVFACRKWAGTPQPREGQSLKWVAPAELSRCPRIGQPHLLSTGRPAVTSS